MKVILLKDVANTGRKGEVKEVNQGHAMNFLIPRKLAKAVSDSEVNQIKIVKEQQKEAEQINKDLAIKELMTLKGQVVSIKAKGNDKGHLFSQIHIEEIQKSLLAQFKISVPKESILLPHPVKEIGEIALTISLYDVKVPVTLNIENI